MLDKEELEDIIKYIIRGREYETYSFMKIDSQLMKDVTSCDEEYECYLLIILYNKDKRNIIIQLTKDEFLSHERDYILNNLLN
jgi:hypothetical protein